jgi:hypothetical protein
MKLRAPEILTADLMKGYLLRFAGGEPFASVLTSWTRETSLSKTTLLDLLRGVYSTSQARAVYAQLRYVKRSVIVSPAGRRVHLGADALLAIRAAARAEMSVAEISAKWRIELATAKDIVKGSYSTAAMRRVLAVELDASK